MRKERQEVEVKTMLEKVKELNKKDVLKWLGGVVAALTLIADYANDGIDIINHAIAVINGNSGLLMAMGQDCTNVIGWIIGRFLGCV